MRYKNIKLRRKMEYHGIQMQELAAKMNLSRGHLSRLFSEELTGAQKECVVSKIEELIREKRKTKIEEKKAKPQAKVQDEVRLIDATALKKTLQQNITSWIFDDPNWIETRLGIVLDYIDKEPTIGGNA